MVSKSRSSASLTVIAPVPELMANGRLLSPSPSVLPPVMDHTRPSSSPVAETVTTSCVGGGGLVDGRLGVGDGRAATFGDRDRDVLGVALGGAVGRLDRQRVGGRGLEVEVVGVVDGDRAGAGVDGERQAVVAVPVGVAVGDGPHVGDVVVAGGRDGRRPLRRRRPSRRWWPGVRDGDGDVRDRDRDVLGVGLGGAVGRLDRQRVGGGGLEVEVVGVVDGDRAGVGVDGEGRLLSPSPSVLPLVMDHVGDVVVAGGRRSDRCVGGGGLVDGRRVSVTVMATFEIVIAVLGVGLGGAVGRLDRQRVRWWSRSRGRRRR